MNKDIFAMDVWAGASQALLSSSLITLAPELMWEGWQVSGACVCQCFISAHGQEVPGFRLCSKVLFLVAVDASAVMEVSSLGQSG